ncbi:hypothetical protein ES705_25695 [subsurface metagenome]
MRPSHRYGPKITRLDFWIHRLSIMAASCRRFALKSIAFLILELPGTLDRGRWLELSIPSAGWIHGLSSLQVGVKTLVRAHQSDDRVTKYPLAMVLHRRKGQRPGGERAAATEIALSVLPNRQPGRSRKERRKPRTAVFTRWTDCRDMTELRGQSLAGEPPAVVRETGAARQSLAASPGLQLTGGWC